MTKDVFTEMIQKLLNGEIDEIKVSHADFLIFREAWLVEPKREHIVGEAMLHGDVIYRYQKSESLVE